MSHHHTFHIRIATRSLIGRRSAENSDEQDWHLIVYDYLLDSIRDEGASSPTVLTSQIRHVT